jgi:hypothetical protein
MATWGRCTTSHGDEKPRHDNTKRTAAERVARSHLLAAAKRNHRPGKSETPGRKACVTLKENAKKSY